MSQNVLSQVSLDHMYCPRARLMMPSSSSCSSWAPTAPFHIGAKYASFIWTKYAHLLILLSILNVANWELQSPLTNHFFHVIFVFQMCSDLIVNKPYLYRYPFSSFRSNESRVKPVLMQMMTKVLLRRLRVNPSCSCQQPSLAKNPAAESCVAKFKTHLEKMAKVAFHISQLEKYMYRLQ